MNDLENFIADNPRSYLIYARVVKTDHDGSYIKWRVFTEDDEPAWEGQTPC